MNLFRIGKRPRDRVDRDSVGLYFSRPRHANERKHMDQFQFNSLDGYTRAWPIHLSSHHGQAQREDDAPALTLDQSGLESRWPNGLVLALHDPPALATGDDGVHCFACFAIALEPGCGRAEVGGGGGSEGLLVGAGGGGRGRSGGGGSRGGGHSLTRLMRDEMRGDDGAGRGGASG